MKLYAGNGDDYFYGPFPQYSSVFAGGGNDTWDVSYQNPGYLPHVHYATEFFAGPGNDKLLLDDSKTHR